MSEDEKREFLSIEEVTDRMKVSRSTIDRLRRKGKLSSVSWKGRLWFSPEDLDEFVSEEGLSSVLRQISQSDRVHDTTRPEVSGSIV